MRQRKAYAAALVVALLSAPAWAVWTDDTVAGVLNFGGGGPNFFDPANGLVPLGASAMQPLAVVSEDDDDFTEFEAFDEVSNFGWAVDVDATTIFVEQATLGAPLGAGSWDIFVSGFDPDVATITPVFDTFPELTTTLENGGDTVHFAFPGGDILPAEGWQAEFTLAPAGGAGGVIPAPGAILLGTLGTGLVGWLRRRRTL